MGKIRADHEKHKLIFLLANDMGFDPKGTIDGNMYYVNFYSPFNNPEKIGRMSLSEHLKHLRK
ncbi:MAG: hypothetical protein Q4F69_04830 [Bacteroidia bacterium]|nr:hypothetical protein [Bacteroidia bacterium]